MNYPKDVSFDMGALAECIMAGREGPNCEAMHLALMIMVNPKEQGL